MFLKIYKHSFLAPLKTLVLLLIIQFALAIFGGIFIRLSASMQENLSLATIFGSMGAMCTIGMTGLSFAEIVIVFSSFRKAVATDEAYLTYTLPATAGQQLGARTLSIATWQVVISIISFFASMVYSALSGGAMIEFDVIVDGVRFTPEQIWLIIEIIIMVIVIVASVLLHVIFGILLSQKFSTRTKTKSANALTVLIGFAEGFVLMVVFITLLVSLLSTDSPALLRASPHLIVWTVTVVFATLGGLCYFLSHKLMSRWLNLA